MNKDKLKSILAVFALLATIGGCGVWDSITESDDDYVKLDGEKGASCTYDSECRSNSCSYPGICD